MVYILLSVDLYNLAYQFTLFSKFRIRVLPNYGQSGWVLWPQRLWLVCNQEATRIMQATQYHHVFPLKNLAVGVLKIDDTKTWWAAFHLRLRLQGCDFSSVLLSHLRKVLLFRLSKLILVVTFSFEWLHERQRFWMCKIMFNCVICWPFRSETSSSYFLSLDAGYINLLRVWQWALCRLRTRTSKTKKL